MVKRTSMWRMAIAQMALYRRCWYVIDVSSNTPGSFDVNGWAYVSRNTSTTNMERLLYNMMGETQLASTGSIAST